MYISIIIFGISSQTGIELIKIILKYPNLKYIYIIKRKKNQKIKLINNNLNKYKIKILKTYNSIYYNIIFLNLKINNTNILLKYLYNNNYIIDLSANFRFNKLQLNKIYKIKYIHILKKKKILYGYTEEQKKIKSKKYISNPGCYVNLSLNIILPIIHQNILKTKNIIIHAINGTTGIGKKIKKEFLHVNQNNNILPYSLFGHKHTLEIKYSIWKFNNKNKQISLCTSHGNFIRGIFIIIQIKKNNNFLNKKKKFINFIYWYNKKNIFIKIYNNNKQNNYKYTMLSKNIYNKFNIISLDISQYNNEIRFIGNSDNLIKGASGTAIENMNLILKKKNSYGF